MDERGQFTFYRSFWEAVKTLPKKDKLPVLEAIIQYALDGVSPSGLSQSQCAFFLLVKPNLDASRKKSANGKQGGSKRKQTESKTEANDKQTESKKEIENEIEIEKEIENEIENECLYVFSGGEYSPASESELALIGLKPGQYPGQISKKTVADVYRETERLFAKNEKPFPDECSFVFSRCCRLAGDWNRIDKNALDLMHYACSAATAAGKSGNRAYINGVLDRLSAREIYTLEQAKDYDESRKED